MQSLVFDILLNAGGTNEIHMCKQHSTVHPRNVGKKKGLEGPAEKVVASLLLFAVPSLARLAYRPLTFVIDPPTEIKRRSYLYSTRHRHEPAGLHSWTQPQRCRLPGPPQNITRTEPGSLPCHACLHRPSNYCKKQCRSSAKKKIGR